MKSEQRGVKENLDTEETVMETLKIQKQQCLDQIKKLQDEIKLIDKFSSQHSETVQQLNKKKRDNEVKISMLNETLEPLKRDKEKYQVLSQNM